MNLSQNELHWINRDHEEALIIDRQLGVAGEGVTPQNVIDLNRFCDCAEDGEGYDVPKERMRSLRNLGLLAGGRFGRYETTEAGCALRSIWFN